MAKKQTRSQMPELSREAVLRFIAENPGRSSKRDIAKAFDIKGDMRVALKDLLADLQAEGLLSGSRKSFKRPGALPPVTVLEIRSRDGDGGLLAEPADWDDDQDGDRPRLSVRQNPKTQTAGLGERILAKIEEAEDGTKTATVIRVLQKSRSLMLGVFRADKHGGGRVEPVERKQNEILIRPGDENGAKDGDLVEADTPKQRRTGLLIGRVVEVVGSAQSERAISAIALHAHGIPHIFPDGVLEEAEAAKPATMAHREDWRSMPLVTIDPPDAKDHDDAVHAAPDDDPNNPGGMIVTVAIADVAAYVRTGTKLDDEAKLRGNSVYFPDGVVPMLPERISNDLCSLKEGVDRPAMAVRMVVDSDGKKRSHSFHRIMMKSRAKLAYEEAQAAFDGTPNEVPADVTETMVRPLWDAYRLVSKARDERSPLALDLPERKLKLNEAGRVAKVVVPERLDAHRLIEEFMILANVAAAETLENKRQALIYRIHDSPSLAKLESLRDFLKTLEISLAKSGSLRPSHFNGILSQVKGTENESLVNEVVLRSQSQAVYEPDNIGHFGLNLARYAHFTSPIRRYADLIVHRALITALGLGDDGLTKEDEADLVEIAEAISQAERRAMAAERDTVDRLIAHFLADQVGEDFPGRITGVTKAGLFVALPTYGADGFVPISTLGNEFFRFDEAARMVVGERSGQGYRLGDAVEICIIDVTPLAGSMQFEMLTQPRKLPRGTQSFHKSQKQTRNHRRSSKNTAAKVRKRK
ncbi:ribonuclease R [Fulvimarina sp. MAC3]|uniref:ribonuclease R n=1 Tax=Fulvimarina sp. MAC3 TaxID=3148887 RepID=UPI0031FCDB7D